LDYPERSKVSALSELAGTLVSLGIGDGILLTLGKCLSNVSSGGVALLICPCGDEVPGLKGSWGELGPKVLSAAERLISGLYPSSGPLRVPSDNPELDPVWAIPIKGRDELLGAILLGRADEIRLRDDMPYLEAIAGQLAEGLERERFLSRMRHLEGKISAFKSRNAILYEVINAVHSSLDLDQILKVVLKCATAGCALGFNRAFLFLIGQGGKFLEGRMAVGPTNIEEAYKIWSELEMKGASLESIISSEGESDLELTKKVSTLRFPMDLEDGPIARAMRDGTAIWIDEDDGKGPVEKELSDVLGLGSFAVAPLVGRIGPLGIIVADNPFSRRVVTEDDVDLFGVLAGQAALAIENSTVHERVKRRVSELETLYEVSEAILSTLDLGVEMNLIARISAQVLGAKGSMLHLIGEEDGKLRVHGAWNVGGKLRHEKILSISDSVARWVVEHGEPLLASDAVDDPRFPDAPESGISSFICVPLSIKGKLIGTITVYDKIPKGPLEQPFFTSSDKEFLAILANEAAIAIENARLFEKVRSTEARLRKMQELLLRSEKLAALGTMIAQVSHEIRNPLVSIGGFARLALKSLPEGDPNREYLEIIADEVKKLEDILKEKLDLKKFSEVKLRHEDINSIIRETLIMVEEEASSKGIEIVTDLPADMPKVPVDAGQMKQAFLNIFRNSIDAMRGGGMLEVTSYSNGQNAHIKISDTGPGIPKEMLGRIFTPFTTDKDDHVGLGLTVAHGIIVNHGGKIDVDTGPGRGTSFMIRLPLRSERRDNGHEDLADS